MDSHAGRVALVTGAASGIGRGLAEALSRAGATVVAADINDPGLEAVARTVAGAGKTIEAVHLDVTDAAAFDRTAAAVFERHGRIDLFFNNAGIGGTYAEVHELTLEEWREVLDVNLYGVIHGIAAVYPRMVRQGSGHVVNTASAAGLIPTPMLAPYTSAKHAVVGLSKAMRAEARAHGVRVSVVCPGFIDTAIYDKSVRYKHVEADKVRALSPNKMSPEECARIILDGVRANRAIIPVTGLAWIAWWLWRLAPGFTLWIAERQVGQVRALRDAPRLSAE